MLQLQATRKTILLLFAVAKMMMTVYNQQDLTVSPGTFSRALYTYYLLSHDTGTFLRKLRFKKVT